MGTIYSLTTTLKMRKNTNTHQLQECAPRVHTRIGIKGKEHRCPDNEEGKKGVVHYNDGGEGTFGALHEGEILATA